MKFSVSKLLRGRKDGFCRRFPKAAWGSRDGITNLLLTRRALAAALLLAVVGALALFAARGGGLAHVTAATGAPPQKGQVADAAPASTRARNALDLLRRTARTEIETHLAAETGSYSFVRAVGNGVLVTDDVAAKPEQRALAFLRAHGGVAGLNETERQMLDGRDAVDSALRVVKVEEDDLGQAHVRLNQFYQGLPVFGGQLIVHLNKLGVTAFNGHFVPEIMLDPTPQISPAEAQASALGVVRKQFGPQMLNVVKIQLSVYRVGLFEGHPGENVLAYSVEVAGQNLLEQVWIDAHTGAFVNRISKKHSALHRTIYTPKYDPTNPDLFKAREEGGPSVPGPVDNLYDFAGHTYNLYASAFGRDSYDALGIRMRSVYLINENCPNAYWDGTSTNYCPGFDLDDVVSHEWSHAYTEYTHGLVYSYQSGALNESYSDIFGEVVDLLNGVDGVGGSNNNEPSPNGQRWLVGEDLGQPVQELLLRDMWDPDRLGSPGKVSSANYVCGASDGGGVHTNSGVPNHGFALLVDGGNYNNQTVAGIGLTKAAAIYYRAMSVYQTPTTNFPLHEQALRQSCTDLIGQTLYALKTNSATRTTSVEVITVQDCAQVAKAMAAVEMSKAPRCNFPPLLDPNTPPVCSGPTDVFTENWEDGDLAGWTLTSTGTFAGWPNFNWTIDSTLPAGRAGKAAFAYGGSGGSCGVPTSDYSGKFSMDSPAISVPSGATGMHVRFDHFVQTEADVDGGNLSISVNGGAFTLIAQDKYEFNAPNSTLRAAPPVDQNTNPKAGQRAWSGSNIGSGLGSWGTTVVNLSSLVQPGQTFKLRWEFGLDGCGGSDGWYVDDIRVYNCPVIAAPTLSISGYENPDTNGAFTLNWTRPAGATGPDVVQVSNSCAPLVSDNAESGLGQWTVASSAVIAPTWENAPANAKPRYNSKTFWAHGAEQQTQNTSTTLTFNNPIVLPATGTTTLNFSEWYFNEDDDRGYVEVSTNNGATWTAVYTNSRSMGSSPEEGATAFANETLTPTQVNLSAYNGQSIRLRFRYAMGGSNFFLYTQFGWYIDNISLTNDSWTDVATTSGTSLTLSDQPNGTRCYRVRTTYVFGAETVLSPPSNVITVTVNANCAPLTLSAAGECFAYGGGTGSFMVNSPGVCGWVVASTADWIHVTANGTGTGNATVSYSIDANPNYARRSGALIVGGQTFVIRQGQLFNDVTPADQFYLEIGKLSARGVTAGCGDGRSYCPGADVTREQMAAFIIRALHEPGYLPPAPGSQRFTDVPPTNPFYAHIEEMALRQITLGCGSGIYCPTNSVTREQMAAFIIRALHVPGYTPPPPASQRFADVPSSNQFYAHIEEMAVRGITLGCGEGNYCPARNVTRAQMAAFLTRAFGCSTPQTP